jgi:hypothetical protein
MSNFQVATEHRHYQHPALTLSSQDPVNLLLGIKIFTNYKYTHSRTWKFASNWYNRCFQHKSSIYCYITHTHTHTHLLKSLLLFHQWAFWASFKTEKNITTWMFKYVLQEKGGGNLSLFILGSPEAVNKRQINKRKMYKFI